MLDIMSNFIGTWMFLFADAGTSTGITDTGLVRGLSCLGAGLAAIGCSGAGIGQGYTGGKLLEAIGRNPEVQNKVFTQFIISAAITESGAIYALVIAIILAFVTKN